MRLTIIPETRWTLPIRAPLPQWLTSRDNGYGGLIVESADGWFHAQRSGHGAWCGLRIGRFEIWADSVTGRPHHVIWPWRER